MMVEVLVDVSSNVYKVILELEKHELSGEDRRVLEEYCEICYRLDGIAANYAFKVVSILNEIQEEIEDIPTREDIENNPKLNQTLREYEEKNTTPT